MSERPDAALPDALELARAHASGERSIAETVEASLERAAALDGTLNAYLELDARGARERARALAAERRTKPDGEWPLLGVPVALKANLSRRGARTSAGSRLLADWRAPYDATAVARLEAAGAIVLGTTNMDEFGMGSSTENSSFGPTRNPWDASRTPGGSSGGSAAAVASGSVAVALGSDTGGSVRQPASLCGVAGFKPTWGRVSRFGLVAFASSLDVIGPLARSVRDLELVTALLSGEDPRDATSAALPPLVPLGRARDLEGIRIGVAPQFFPAGVSARARGAVEAAIAHLVTLGADAQPVELPHLEYALSTYYVIATAEASSNLARFDGVRYGARRAGDGSLEGMIGATRAAGFGAEVARRVLLGSFVLSAGFVDEWFQRAQRVRRLLTEDFERAFSEVDVLAAPTTPGVAFALGARVADPLAMYAEDALTVPASLAGLPAVSLPCGFAEEGGRRLPLGLQLIGPALQDAVVLQVARLFEETTDFRALPPFPGVRA